MTPRFTLACGVLAAVVLATTAGDQWPDHPAPPPAGPTQAAAARPAAETSSMQALGKPDCTPQNRRASLRPAGPLPAPGQMPAGSTMARIAARGHLVAGINQDTQAFAFRDEKLRQQGFEIDIIRDVAEAILGDRERVMFRQVTIAERNEAVKSGEIDLVIARMSITCPRREEMEFSAVYLETGQRVLVNRSSGITDLAGLEGRPVCATQGSTGENTVRAAVPKLIPVTAPNTTDCLVLLQLGQVDAICAGGASLSSMTVQDPQTEVVGPQLTDEPVGAAINKDAPDLVRFVNAVLERRAQDGRWRASYQRWLMPLLGPPPLPPAPQYQD